MSESRIYIRASGACGLRCISQVCYDFDLASLIPWKTRHSGLSWILSFLPLNRYTPRSNSGIRNSLSMANDGNVATDPSEIARPSFPTNPADFDADDRISFSKLDNKFILETEDGQEFEFDDALKRWVPSVCPQIPRHHRMRVSLAAIACGRLNLMRWIVGSTVGQCPVGAAETGVCRAGRG